MSRKRKEQRAGAHTAARRWGWLAALGACVAGGVGVLALVNRQTAGPDEYGYEVVNTYPHDAGAFTQGLLIDGGKLYEGTGKYGRSALRRVDLETGKVLQEKRLDDNHFGEGIAVVEDEIFQLTWENGIGIVYDKKTFAEKRRFSYKGEGWGLTYDGEHLVMSDGSAELRFLDPRTGKEAKPRVAVTSAGRPVDDLNELEHVAGEIFANVYGEDRIARIDPDSGRVTGWIDLKGLLPARRRPDPEAILNGIAYDRAAKRLFVTGKNWPKLFEVRIISK